MMVSVLHVSYYCIYYALITDKSPIGICPNANDGGLVAISVLIKTYTIYLVLGYEIIYDISYDFAYPFPGET